MKLSVASWSFHSLTFDEATGLAKVLGIDAIDVGYFGHPALDKAKLLAEPESYGRDIAAASPVPIANLFHLFGDSLHDRNLALPPDPQNLADLKTALAFAKAAGAPSVFILPGMINPGQSRADALTASAESLKPMVVAGKEVGIKVLVEPHVQGILEQPEITEELLEKVPGLGIVLDPSHFAVFGHSQASIEALAGHAGHVHLRQAKPGQLQAKMDEGTLNFASFFGALRDANYDGWCSIEYEHDSFMNSLHDDVLTETVRMRDCFRNWWSANG